MNVKQMVKACDGKFETELRFRLYRYCLSLTRSKQEAEDLMQETLLKAEIRRQRYGDHVNPEALLLRMAKNSWIDHLRRSALYRDILKQKKKQFEEIQDRDDKSKERMAAAFHVLVRNLSPSQRIVLLLREVFGYSTAECSTYLGTTEGAVKSLLHRARRALETNRSGGVDNSQRDIGVSPDTGDADVDEMVEAYVRGDIGRLLRLVSRTEGEANSVVEAIGSHQTGDFGSAATVFSYGAWKTMELRLAS